ncbi:hypothetical protein Pcinc_034643 [Petrolisthes cinctipes]|uniref:Uncharacterized protein n=1 Tax=Petrolisthes cinctipes TaxID=88211 RepID=A0AAE1BZY0_PETCI|nr:hypothetical protein Pcinc_034643 [Petrolisthes cinctipes]
MFHPTVPLSSNIFNSLPSHSPPPCLTLTSNLFHSSHPPPHLTVHPISLSQSTPSVSPPHLTSPSQSIPSHPPPSTLSHLRPSCLTLYLDHKP